jgi:murein L,D-transpeptidase YcbB/YkuD
MQILFKKKFLRYVVVIFVLNTTVFLTSCTNSYVANKIKQPQPSNQLLVKKDYLEEIAPLKKDYKIGDKGPEVVKIEEWLMLWQLNENFISDLIKIVPDKEFDKTTEKILKQVQLFVNLPATGVVDHTTWKALFYFVSHI